MIFSETCVTFIVCRNFGSFTDEANRDDETRNVHFPVKFHPANLFKGLFLKKTF